MDNLQTPDVSAYSEVNSDGRASALGVQGGGGGGTGGLRIHPGPDDPEGEVEVRREGRRVYVRMHGPEYPSD